MTNKERLLLLAVARSRMREIDWSSLEIANKYYNAVIKEQDDFINNEAMERYPLK